MLDQKHWVLLLKWVSLNTNTNPLTSLCVIMGQLKCKALAFPAIHVLPTMSAVDTLPLRDAAGPATSSLTDRKASVMECHFMATVSL